MGHPVVFSVIVAALGCATPVSKSSAQTVAPSGTPPARSEPLCAEDIVDLDYVTSVSISPGGTRIAYVVRTARDPLEGPGGRRSIIWVTGNDGAQPRRYTAPTTSSSSPAWSPDGKWLAFRSARNGQSSRIWRLPAVGGEAIPVTSRHLHVHQFEWSPDGMSIAFTADLVPTTEERRAIDEGRDWHTSDVFGAKQQLSVVDVDTGDMHDVTLRDQHISDFEWSPGGDRFVVTAADRADVDAVMMYSRLFVVDATGGSMQPLAPTAGKLGDVEWSPDGGRVAFLGANDLSDPTAGVLYVVSSEGGEPRALTAELEATGQSLAWTEPDRILMLANRGTRTPLLSVDPRSGKLTTIADEGPVCRSLDIDAKGRTLACSGSTAMRPRELFTTRLGRSARWRRRTNSNPELRTKKLGAREIVRRNAADGLGIEGVVTKPVGYEEGRRYPLAVLVHGGPEGVSLDGWNTRATYPVQLFATAGYVVLEPNYRGSQGRGVAFGKADRQDLGGKEFEDVLAGIDALAERGLIDPNRVGMGGWSYGGYFSGLAATKHSGRFKAAMVGAAITNWVSFTGTTEIEHENSLVHWNLWPYDHFELAWDRSPVAHTQGSKTATLVVHGQDDTRVPPEQAMELYRALKYFEVDTELVLYPREGHGLGERAHEIDFSERFVGWLDEHLAEPNDPNRG